MRFAETPYFYTNKEWYHFKDGEVKLSPKGEAIPEVKKSYDEAMAELDETELVISPSGKKK